MRRLSIESPTQLQNLPVAWNIENVHIVGNPQFFYEMSVYYNIDDAEEFLTAKDIPLATRQNWIDLLAGAESLRKLDLSYLPLEGVDLSGLAKCPDLEWLELSHANLTYAEIATLKELPNLSSLGLSDQPATGKLVEYLCKKYPMLSELKLNMENLSRLRLRGIPQLATLDSPAPYRTANWDALELVDTPAIKDAFDFRSDVKHVHLENCPKISGLSFRGPLPKHFVFDGSDSLKYFTAGGPEFDDDLLKRVLQSAPNLEKLTIAFASVTPEALQEISQCHQLKSLTLTGSAVDDSVIAGWDMTALQNLEILRLEETQITATSLAHIAKLPKLRWLSLNKINGAGFTCSDLAGLTNLERLGLSGLPLKSQDLALFASLEKLMMLELTDCQVEADFVQTLAQHLPISCQELWLVGVNLDPEQFHNLIKERFLYVGANSESMFKETLEFLKSKSRFMSWAPNSAMTSISPYLSTAFFSELFGANDVFPEKTGLFRGDVNPWLFASLPNADNLVSPTRLSSPIVDSSQEEPRSAEGSADAFGKLFEQLKAAADKPSQ
ncbi:MAG: hypothetical protein R3C53_11005 [Pirellulaceae bacterium]